MFRRPAASSFSDTEDIAQKIFDAFGGILVVISQMASVIRRQDFTLPEFLELWSDHEQHASFYKTKFNTNLVAYPHSLTTIWAFDRLPPYARQLLELISFLDPDVIGEDLLMNVSNEILPSAF